MDQIDSPFYTATPSPSASVQMMSVDILPSQIPRDASEHFSSALMPYLRTLVRQYQGKTSMDDAGRVETMERATIAQNGKLRGSFKWLAKPLREHQSQADAALLSNLTVSTAGSSLRSVKKKILLLGSGMVARPAIEEFNNRKDVQLVIG